ncbi:MAG: hypothetical protein H7222_00820 [Methylotenera sp.]|nr:hypothetical protein [Oligoflexia bacterium]
MKLSEKDSRLLEVCIQELEVRTCAEVVLVVRESSGNYRDVAHLIGAVSAWGLLLAAMSVPTEIPEYWLPLPMLFVFWTASWLIQHSPARVWFVTKKRKKVQVAKAAHACFYEKKIHQTTSHTGILVYCSLLEGRAEIVMDHTAEKALNSKRILEFQDHLITQVCKSTDRLRGLLEVLRTFGLYLGQELPPSTCEKPNELENAPDFSAGEEI